MWILPSVPYEFIDTDGEYKGIAADYIKLISERTGLNMVVQKDLTWSEAYEKGVQRELDVLPCVSKTAERQRYFQYSEPYYTFQRVIFTNENNKNIKGFDDLKNITVAVQENSSHHSYLKAFPDIKLSLYQNVDEALQAVSSGKEAAFVGNLATSSYFIKADGITNLKVVEIESEDEQSLYFAVRNDWPELVGIINKGLASITKEEKMEINNRWVSINEAKDYSHILKIIAIVGGIIGLIILVSFYWIILLRKEIKVRRKVQEDLNIAKEEAELANHVKSTFLARMSHEIRTPLNAIVGVSYLLKKTDLTGTQRMYLEKVTDASRTMLGIINDILDFSKIEAGKIELERISFNLDKVIQHVINIIYFKIEEQGIEFSMTKDPAVPTYFWGDPTRLEQLLLNLANNAVKFTAEGTVSLSVNLIENKDNICKLEFRVEDTGIGISEEQIDQLFKPFEQGESSINRRFGGSGLGLSIVKSFVELMGGTIQVQSSLGKGSAFIVKIDLAADFERENEMKTKSKNINFPDVNILVLEKSNTDSNLLKEYLSSFHIDAAFANSEEQAMELLGEASNKTDMQYNLLLVDQWTPKDGGIAFIKRIKESGVLPEMPKTMLMIPLTKQQLFEEAEASGIDFTITKPVLPSVLFNGIMETFRVEVLDMQDDSRQRIRDDSLHADYPYHILLVEDNKTNQFIGQTILEQAGFKVSLAENGQEGYKFFVEHKENLDLILMDLDMPVLNGYEASALIRKLDTEIPIVAMTADAIAGVEEKCRSFGLNYYISKPFEPDVFIKTILNILLPKKNKAKPEKTETTEKDAAEQKEKPALDEAAGLKMMGDNRDLYLMVLKEYYQENLDVGENLADEINSDRYLDASHIVHKIKSSSGNIGAESLFQVSGKLQKALVENDIAAVPDLHNQFQLLLKQVMARIKEILDL